jgi:hypothetical protein
MTDRSSSPLPPTIRSVQIHPPPPLHASSSPAPDILKIFRDALLLTEGRDKCVKLLQYTSRLILLVSASAPRERLKPFITQMSLTRKVLKLGHGVFPYSELMKGRLKTLAVVRATVEIMNDFWDDVYCLSRIGFLRSKKLQKWAEDWANRAWMTGILMDLYVLFGRRESVSANLRGMRNREKYLNVETEERKSDLEKMRVEAYWIDVSIVKLFADFGFCGEDHFWI